MLKRTDLEKMKTATGFNAGQAEKDYLQHMFLLFLSRHTKNELVFKGGTALQKAYGLNRFSIDLDFTLNREISAREIIDRVIADLNKIGCMTIAKYTPKGTGVNAMLKIQGPLYDGREKTLASLKIEISSREKILLDPAWKEIVPPYSDLQPYIAYIMQPEEILVEKILAIMTRTKARDVYDLWFLLKKGFKFDADMAKKKLEYCKKEWDFEEFKKKISTVERIWQAELAPLIAAFPDFPCVKKYVLEQVSNAKATG